MKNIISKASLAIAGLSLLATCASGTTELQKVMTRRHLSQQDLLAAAKTYLPSGHRDKYMVFSSGGQSGQVIVWGVPSMKILKYIGVFTPEPWQGWGYDDDTKKILAEGNIRGKKITWGDTHHPALSETDGKYDGKWLVINDKANPRIAVIDLRDFVTKQIVVNPVLKSEHGGAFFTPNSEYILSACQYAAPFDNNYHPMSEYQTVFRGGVTMWKFNDKTGRINTKKSFTLELPPYMQDLSDAGKKVSYGWGFTNSFNSEMYTGGIEKGLPPFEAGCSRSDTDFLHVYNWKDLAKLAKDPKNYKMINGMKVIPISVAVKHHDLFLIPEEKSPHGVDVSPDGKYIVVCGKLDTHDTVFSWKKIKKAIDNHDYIGHDPYGIPILSMKKTMHCQAELGLGPLHDTFGKDWKNGEIYTSLYVDSQVVRWNYLTCKVQSKINVSYNIGHMCGMEGKTETPQGDYVIALDKLSIDRFDRIGPLHPQNEQLIDIRNKKKMQLLYDLPIGLGEPHEAVAIRISKLHPWKVYPIGWDSFTMTPSKYKTLAGQERIVRKGHHVIVYGTVVRSHINPEHVTVNLGDTVTFHLTNLERAEDETHGFTVDDYNVHTSLEPGKTVSVSFKADREGVFPYYCTEFCSALHLEMFGYLLVKDPNKHYVSVKQMKMKKMSPKQLKAQYDKIVATNKATNKVILGVVKFLKTNHYQKYPLIKQLVNNNAMVQYAKVAKQQKLAEKNLKEGKVMNAILFQNEAFQYLVKTATVGIRAQKLLVLKAATPMSPAAKRGHQAYLEGGCNGCHVIGKVSSGPDLVGVLQRHQNGEKWVKEWILNPKKDYHTPYIEALYHYFKMHMPNQGMTGKQVDDIIQYLKWIDKNANLF